MTVTIALIALGSNVASDSGNPARTVRAAVQELDALGVIRSTSTIYRTPAFPPGSGPDFANAAVALATEHAAPDLLSALHRIEAEFGRKRRKRWGARTLDLDLLAFGDQVLPSRGEVEKWVSLPSDQQQTEAPDGMIVPHPRLQDRAFVLVPLGDVAEDWRHPVLGLTVRQMLEHLSPADVRQVIPWK